MVTDTALISRHEQNYSPSCITDNGERAAIVLAEYADGLDGLSLEEASQSRLCFTQEQAQTFVDVLSGNISEPGRGGLITLAEHKQMRGIGIPEEIISGIAGPHGSRALQARARWLGEHIRLRTWRIDYSRAERITMIRELGGMGVYASEALEALRSVEVRSLSAVYVMSILSPGTPLGSTRMIQDRIMYDSDAFVDEANEAIRQIWNVSPSVAILVDMGLVRDLRNLLESDSIAWRSHAKSTLIRMGREARDRNIELLQELPELYEALEEITEMGSPTDTSRARAQAVLNNQLEPRFRQCTE